MRNLLAATLLLVSFALSGPSTDTTVTTVAKCKEIERTATGNLFTVLPVFVSTVVFIPVPVVSYVILGVYMTSATKISMDYSHEGCSSKISSQVATR